MRVGIGYDVHRLAEGRKLILGGVEIPFEKGLLGHSDADVLTHAIIDAILGAADMGDIGNLFPDTDGRFKDVYSINLLRIVGRMLKEKGYCMGNIDSVIVAESPKLSKYYAQMKKNLAEALGVDVSIVNVKAKTEEGLGFTGQKLGMAAHAVVLIVNERISDQN